MGAYRHMLSAILPVRSLLLAILILMAGNGFMSTLVGVRLENAGSSALAVGLVGTAYFAGLVVGSLKAGGLVGRVGHIRAFAAFVSALSASTLIYATIGYAAIVLQGKRYRSHT